MLKYHPTKRDVLHIHVFYIIKIDVSMLVNIDHEWNASSLACLSKVSLGFRRTRSRQLNGRKVPCFHHLQSTAIFVV
jgi:hypothetical protein